jgi:ferredoxin
LGHRLNRRYAVAKIVVDYDSCEANAVCVGIIPEVFYLDDDDNLWLHSDDVTPENEGRLRQAVASCPKAALKIVDE